MAFNFLDITMDGSHFEFMQTNFKLDLIMTLK